MKQEHFVQPGGSPTVEHILLPVTGLENNGQPVAPKGEFREVTSSVHAVIAGRLT